MLVSVFHPCAICRGVTERISFLFSFSSRNLQSSSILCSLCLLYMGMGFSTESCYGCMTCPLLPDVNKLFDFLLWLWLHLSTGPGYWINLTHRSYFRCSLARYPGSCALLYLYLLHPVELLNKEALSHGVLCGFAIAIICEIVGVYTGLCAGYCRHAMHARRAHLLI
jgi:hypothetical protein